MKKLVKKRGGRNFNLALFIRKEKKKIRRKRRISSKLKKNKKNRGYEFISFIDNTNFTRLKKIKKNKENLLKIKIPEVFSLIRNPEGAIEIYEMLYKAIKKNGINGVYIDHSNCRDLEIGASTVMDVFVMNLKNYKEKKNGKFICRGKMPPNEKDKIALLASGILKRLEFPDLDDKVAELQGNGKIACLDMISGGNNTSTFKVDNSITSDIVATNVSDYFEECLKVEDLGITSEGKAYFSSLVGETINNCELHSGDFKQFFTLGHYYSGENTGYGECQLVIFNFGQTIYEGLKNNSKDEGTIDSLQNLTRHHLSKGLFKNTVWDEEVLWTLYALQDGVSRAKNEDDPDRGTGTVALIKSFQEIGANMNGNKPEMSILSGSSFIHFDGTYKISSQKVGEDLRDIIAFNDTNNLFEAPDKKYVKKLNKYFPGTIICLDFYIDKDYIIKLKDDKHD